MSQPKKVAAVVNPHSSGGRTARQWPELKNLLESRLGPVTARFTDRHGAGIPITRSLLDDGFELVIAVGGDGTINEVANGFFDEDRLVRPQAELGILPLGTGGDFRRTLQIPPNPAAAVEILAGDASALIDVGKATFLGNGGATASRYFVNLLSFGMGGRVAAGSKNVMGVFGGKAAFFWSTVKAFLSYHGRQVSLTLDENETPSPFFVTNVAVGNGQFHGGGMWPCPAARMNDGIFDVTVIDYAGALELLRNISVLYSGEVYSHPRVHHFQASKVQAESNDTAEIEIDGEPLGTLPVEITILTRKLRVKVPGKSDLLEGSG